MNIDFAAIQALRTKILQARAATVASGAAMAQAQAAHVQAARAGQNLAPARDAARTNLQRAQSAELASHAELRTALAGSMPEGVGDEVGSLDAQHPIALLPVKVEVHFSLDGPAKQLLVRVFPDSLCADGHEPELTAAELSAGQAYWTAGWDPPAEAAAWTLISTRYGAPRAAWIVHTTEPTNLDTRPAGAPAFPTPPARGSSWTRPVLARAMPDRWIAVATRGDKVVKAAGSPIVEPLALSLAPTPLDPSHAPGELPVDDGTAWMVKFERAESDGMALRLPLDDDDAKLGFDRLIVVGVKASSDAEASAQELAQLFDAQSYSRDFSFVPHGTVLAGDSSPVATAVDPATTFRRERGAPSALPGTDGAAFFASLGLDLEKAPHLGRVALSEGTQAQAAGAMACALWQSTGGYFIDQMLAPPFAADVSTNLREHFSSYVRARGHLPTLRLDATPYATLITTSLARFTSDDPFETQLIQVLTRMRTAFQNAAAFAPCVGANAQQDPLQTTLQILATDASARQVAIRRSLGPDGYAELDFWEALGVVLIMLGVQGALQGVGVPFDPNSPGIQGLVPGNPHMKSHKSLARIGTIFFQKAAIYPGPLAAAAPLSETDGLAPFANSDQNYLGWLRTADINALGDPATGLETMPAGTDKPDALLYQLLRLGLLQAAAADAHDLLMSKGLATPQHAVEPERVDAQKPNLWGITSQPLAVNGGASIASCMLRQQMVPLKALAAVQIPPPAPPPTGMAAAPPAAPPIAPRTAPLATWPRLVTKGPASGAPIGDSSTATDPLQMKDPAKAGKPGPPPQWSPVDYTSYVAWPPARTKIDVMNAARNNSFVSRMLRVLSEEGEAANFETVNGLDGLTFALEGVAGDAACAGFFSELRERYQSEFDAAFGSNGQNLWSLDWIKKNNGGGARSAGANDHGLVRFRWVRDGLDHLLATRHLHGWQLARFVSQTIRRAALPVFQERRFKFEASLAAIAVVMSTSPDPPFKDAPPKQPPSADDERASVRKLVEMRLRSEKETSKPAADALLQLLDGKGGTPPAAGELGALGRRVLLLAQLFPTAASAGFGDLGTFTLDPDQVFAADPTTSANAVAPAR